jgi:hypothetical protein
MRIDSSGRLFVNTTSGTYRLNVQGASTDGGYFNFTGGSTARGFGAFTNSAATEVGYIGNAGGGAVTSGGVGDFGIASAAGNLIFGRASGASESMRIDSSGNVLINRTTAPDFGSNTTTGIGFTQFNILTASRASGETLALQRSGTDGVIAYFFKGTTIVGNISVTGSATAYNTSSDYRLKENIAPMTGALDKVSALKPVTYKWKADGSDGQGFIAHELAEVCPDAVSGEKDAVDENGKPLYQGIDTSYLVATLTAAIQELKAEFDAYKASHP